MRDGVNQLDDYGAAFCEQQYTHACYISLSIFKLSDQSYAPRLPKILRIYSAVVRKRMLGNRPSVSNQPCDVISWKLVAMVLLLRRKHLHNVAQQAEFLL